MPSGGVITIRSRRDEDGVALAVEDEGTGMSKDVLRHAQEPFFTTKGLKSTGLGLSVAYAIVQRHEGSLGIESTPGRGTTVTIRLPARVDERRPAAGGPPAPGNERRFKILVVDDEPEVREALADLLDLDGHAVTQAGSGREALALLHAGELPDAVLTDLGMPEMTGWDVAAAVKNQWPQITVGLVTGWGQEPKADMPSGSVDFILGKPIDLDDLRARLLETVTGSGRLVSGRPAGRQ
jgi:CheY-like chemotaxis protein